MDRHLPRPPWFSGTATPRIIPCTLQRQDFESYREKEERLREGKEERLREGK
jgi:hypothetical protein